MLVNLFRLILVVVGFRVVCLRMETMINTQSPDTHTVKYAFYPSYTSRDAVGDVEKRVAQNFLKDTIPGLIRRGLITKYERNESGTRIMVSGRVWKKRSQFFKQSFMTALQVYDRLERLQPHARIVDNTSGALYAEISPDSKIALYD